MEAEKLLFRYFPLVSDNCRYFPLFSANFGNFDKNYFFYGYKCVADCQ